MICPSDDLLILQTKKYDRNIYSKLVIEHDEEWKEYLDRLADNTQNHLNCMKNGVYSSGTDNKT